MTRWRLESIDAPIASYTFEINPNAQEPPFAERSIAWNFHPATGFTGLREGRTGHAWSFSGVLRSQGQYDELLNWVALRRKVYLFDDRGDRLTVRLVRFNPQQRGGARSRTAPWRWTYEMSCLVYDYLEAS